MLLLLLAAEEEVKLGDLSGGAMQKQRMNSKARPPVPVAHLLWASCRER